MATNKYYNFLILDRTMPLARPYLSEKFMGDNMSHRKIVALIVGVCVSIAPITGAAIAQTPPAPSAASLQQTISAAARNAASAPNFSRLTKAQKLAAIQAAVAAALAATGASPAQISAALIQAVGANIISAGVAISIASMIAPEMAQQVASAPVVVAQLSSEGQSASISATASTDGSGAPTVLVSLQGTTGGGGATTTPAPYDPCAGVIAAYCGS